MLSNVAQIWYHWSSLEARGVWYAKFLLIQYFIDINILQNCRYIILYYLIEHSDCTSTQKKQYNHNSVLDNICTASVLNWCTDAVSWSTLEHTGGCKTAFNLNWINLDPSHRIQTLPCRCICAKCPTNHLFPTLTIHHLLNQLIGVVLGLLCKM